MTLPTEREQDIMTAAYLRQEITTDHDGRRSFRPHVSVWSNGTRLDDVDLPVDTPTAMSQAATAILSGAYHVGPFVAPRSDSFGELDWRAELTPRADLPA